MKFDFLKKLTGPGFFRLFLALAVFAHHVSRFSIGTSAVCLFFSLSGYWIFTMWQHRYSVTEYPYLTYIVSRLWRLLPVFLLVSAIAVIFEIATGLFPRQLTGLDTWPHFIASNLLILGYYSLSFKPLGPAWSLDVELQFYVIAPLLVILFGRLTRPLVALFSLGVLSGFAVIFLNDLPLSNYLVFFLIGMVAASLRWEPTPKLAFLSASGTSLLIVGCLLSPLKGVLLGGTHPWPLHIYNSEANYLLALTLIPYAIYTTRQKGFNRDGMFADLSYIVYLLHWVGIIWLGERTGSTLYRVGLIILVFIVVMSLSLVIWKFYDRPINTLRSKWVSKRKIGVIRGESPATPAVNTTEASGNESALPLARSASHD